MPRERDDYDDRPPRRDDYEDDREEIDDRDEGYDSPPAFPGSVKAAGVIWLVFGCLILLNALVTVLLAAVGAGGGGGMLGGVCGGLFGLLVGGVFLHVGIQTARGAAKDTLGNGIGSIIFGLLNGGSGLFLILGVTVLAATGRPVEQGRSALLFASISGGIGILAGIGLEVAGVMALVGRQGYKDWKRSQRPRRRRRR